MKILLICSGVLLFVLIQNCDGRKTSVKHHDQGTNASTKMNLPINELEVGPQEFSEAYLQNHRDRMQKRPIQVLTKFLGHDSDFFYLAALPLHTISSTSESVMLLKTKRSNFPDGFPSQEVEKEWQKINTMEAPGCYIQEPSWKMENKVFERIITERGIQDGNDFVRGVVNKIDELPVNELEVGPQEFSEAYLRDSRERLQKRRLQVLTKFLGHDSDFFYVAVFSFAEVTSTSTSSVMLLKTQRSNFPDGFPDKRTEKELNDLLVPLMSVPYIYRPDVTNKSLEEIIVKRNISGGKSGK